MRVHQLNACPGCRSERFATFDLGGSSPLRHCSSCGLVFAPEYGDPKDVYVDGYMVGGGGPFGVDVRGASFQGYLNRVGHWRLAAIERATSIRRGAILDVGCGTGEVLLAAGERGWDAKGVEPESSSATIARERGLEVENALLEESGIPERSYDVVSAFHVLEHIPDSIGFLQTMARWIKPGGFLAVEVPNFNSTQRRRWRDKWIGYRPLEHVVHFTPKTLGATLERAGLRPVLMRSPSYLGPPQNVNHALNDLARHGPFRLLARLLTRGGPDGARYPTRAGWALIHAMESLYDRAGTGLVVFCVARPL